MIVFIVKVYDPKLINNSINRQNHLKRRRGRGRHRPPS
jgi:hypothetical protein